MNEQTENRDETQHLEPDLRLASAKLLISLVVTRTSHGTEHGAAAARMLTHARQQLRQLIEESHEHSPPIHLFDGEVL